MYPVRRVMDHMNETGLSFHAAADDLERRHGPAPTYACAECGEKIVNEPDTLCGACLFPDEEDEE